MGMYNFSVLELKDLIWEALDNAEGDFTRGTLCEALEICKDYYPVSDEILPGCDECDGKCGDD
jgi:hypothetical protein